MVKPRAQESARSLADRVHSTAIRLLRLLRKEDEATGLSPARASAMSVLVFRGPMTLGELAAAEQVQPPTMSRLVAALEADGLVTRRAHPEDRRATVLAPTAPGEKLLHKGRERRVGRLTSLLEQLTAADRERLGAATDLLATLLAQPATAAAAPTAEPPARTSRQATRRR